MKYPISTRTLTHGTRRSRWYRAAVLFLCVLLLLSASSCLSPGGSQAQSEAGKQTEGEDESLPGAAEDASNAAEKRQAELEEQARKERRKAEEAELKPAEGRTRAEFAALVRAQLPERFLLLNTPDGSPVSIYHDLDRNGYEDGFFLLLDRKEAGRLLNSGKNPADNGDKSGSEQAENGKEALINSITTDQVGDMSTLLAQDTPAVGYYLAVYLQRAEGIVSMYRLPLGSWKVFDSFDSLAIDKQDSMPFCLTTAFQTQEGSEHQWVIFYRYDKFSIFTFSDSISTSFEIEDIDDDQIVDVLEWHKVFEEGTGYETYVTWYRWDGTGFSRYKTTNIVRNLNSFLARAAGNLEQGRWASFIDQSLRAQDQQRISALENSQAQFSRLFGAEEPPPESLDFQKVLFPNIFENPFSSGNSEKQDANAATAVRFSVRFVHRSGESQVRQCEVGINSNPFADREFFFMLLK